MFQITTLLVGLAIIVILIAVLAILQRAPGQRNIPIARVLPLGLAALAGIAALIVSLIGIGKEGKEFLDSVSIGNASRSDDIKMLSLKVDSLERNLESFFLKMPIDTTTVQKTNLDALSLPFLKLNEKVDKNSQAIAKFESLLITDSERLISLPIVLHDLQSLKDDIKSVEQGLSNIYTIMNETNEQNRWVIGTLAFGLLSLVLTAFLTNMRSIKKSSEFEEISHKD